MTVDEMTQVRELRADAPVADRARLAPGRARLLETALTGKRSRVARGRRRPLMIAAVFVAVTAVVATATLLIDGHRAGREGTPATAPGLDLKGMSAPELLEFAARTVQEQPPLTEPRADQWIYAKETQEGDDDADFALEKWLRYDGAELAFHPRPGAEDPGELETIEVNLEGRGDEYDDRSPRQMYRFLSTLPADGEGTLEALREENALVDDKSLTQAENDYAEISVLLDAYVQPPKGLAGLYRALATMPGGELVDHLVEDEAGQYAVAVRFPEPGRKGGKHADEWLLDPVTFEIVGERMIEDGEVAGGNAYIVKAVVDEAGRRA
ncbi:CU044_5270 family protein [Streptomyces sp. NPDC093568]|uniref:CU044_5270 family protein n=1 Tax=Streptomyces sp. NPDC093568 TaxID=3366041 RepID=UPI003811778A